MTPTLEEYIIHLLSVHEDINTLCTHQDVYTTTVASAHTMLLTCAMNFLGSKWSKTKRANASLCKGFVIRLLRQELLSDAKLAKESYNKQVRKLKYLNQ